MANREACELLIEQEIEQGLKEGKTPYSIGKSLSKWVEKLFDTKINHRTIEQRARRKNATNVTKETEPDSEEEIEYDYDDIAEEKPEYIHTETHEVSDAMFFVTSAIEQLSCKMSKEVQ